MSHDDPFDSLATTWNQAQAYHYRLHQLFQYANSAKIIGDLNKWYFTLAAIRTELVARMKDEEIIVCDSLLLKARKIVQSSTGNVGVESHWILREKLDAAETSMRVIMRDRGMDLPSANDPGLAVDETDI